MHALILAGGQGRRLNGADKALLPLRKRPMVERVIERLTSQVEGIAISAAGDFTRFDRFGLTVLDDGDFQGKGPLAGVLAGLGWADGPMVTVPVDTPFVPADLVARLGPAPAVAAYRGRVHHLVAVWPAGVQGALAAFLRGDGPYRVADFAASIGMRAVEFSGAHDPFLNINTPDDLAAAERRPW